MTMVYMMGGHKDGDWLDVASVSPVLKCPKMPAVSTMSISDLNAMASAKSQFEVCEYHRTFYWSLDKILFFYAIDGMTPPRLPGWLVADLVFMGCYEGGPK